MENWNTGTVELRLMIRQFSKSSFSMDVSQSRLCPALQLKSKPRQCEVNARDHRSRRDYPQPTQPEPLRPSLGEKCGNKANHERSKCSRRSPAVPVHRGREERHRRCGDIPRMARAQENDAKRGINGEKREIQLERHRVENGERGSVCKCETAERARRRHDPKPL